MNTYVVCKFVMVTMMTVYTMRCTLKGSFLMGLGGREWRVVSAGPTEAQLPPVCGMPLYNA